MLVTSNVFEIKMLAFATDELSCRVGQTLAGLLNATLVRADRPDAFRQY